MNYDELQSKYVMIIKILIENNNIDELALNAWIEIIKILLNSKIFNMYFVKIIFIFQDETQQRNR